MRINKRSLNKRSLINSYNRRRVLETIRTEGPVIRADVARATGLSIPTVMKISNEFVARGIVAVAGKAKSSDGKPPELLEIAPDAPVVLGIDLSKDDCTCSVMDIHGKLRSYVTIPKKWEDLSFEKLIVRVLDTAERAVDTSGFPKNKVMGIGIGVPGIIDREREIVRLSVSLGWENVDVIKPIYRHFGIPVFLENSAKVTALAERWFGYGKNHEAFACVIFGQGIGLAICIDGEIYAGNRGSSGELGHITVEPDGPLCRCGNRGCLEAVASDVAIRRQAIEMISLNRQTSIIDIAGTSENISAKIVFDAAKQGDPVAEEIVTRAIKYLGIGIADCINILDPGMIILSGGLVKAGDYFVDWLRREVGRRLIGRNGDKPEIMVSSLGENASVIGAATLPLKDFIYNGGEFSDFSLKERRMSAFI